EARKELITSRRRLQCGRRRNEVLRRRSAQRPVRDGRLIAKHRPAILSAPRQVEYARCDVGCMRVRRARRRTTTVLDDPIESRDREALDEVDELRPPE